MVRTDFMVKLQGSHIRFKTSGSSWEKEERRSKQYIIQISQLIFGGKSEYSIIKSIFGLLIINHCWLLKKIFIYWESILNLSNIKLNAFNVMKNVTMWCGYSCNVIFIMLVKCIELSQMDVQCDEDSDHVVRVLFFKPDQGRACGWRLCKNQINFTHAKTH